MKRFLALTLSLALALPLAACGGSGNGSTPAGGNATDVPAEASTELNIYMWQQYISDALIADFESQNNCKINLSYMSDNADAITKLTAGGGQEYDLIMTCDAYMDSLVAGGYVQKLNLDNIPNSSNINEAIGPRRTTASPIS